MNNFFFLSSVKRTNTGASEFSYMNFKRHRFGNAIDVFVFKDRRKNFKQQFGRSY